MRCPLCHAENPNNKRFCGDCGAPLSNDRSEIPPSARPLADGERRHLTVLFCDLVNSTAIAAQLDPEEWREIVADYHRTTARAIERFGGYVAHYLGDGVMAFFGYPAAHENDAERAARAGLAIVDGIAVLNRKPARPKLSARVGIHSGAVVVGGGAGTKVDVFGDTPNIAARVQTAAAADSLLITSATYRLLSGRFTVEDCGAQVLKGIETPLQLYRVIQPSGVREHPNSAAARGLAAFVGREAELRLLTSRWECTQSGKGQMVLIVGEAGIGKSRLVQEFHARLNDTHHTWIECAGEQFFENAPFHPISEALERWLTAQGCVGIEQRAHRLEQVLKSVGLQPAEGVPLLMDLLGDAPPEHYAPLFLTPEQRRRRLFATMAGWVLGAARVRATVFVMEDLHWADPSTIEFIQMLLQQGVGLPVLLLFTTRPEFTPPWSADPDYAQLILTGLSDNEVREMVNGVAAQLSGIHRSTAELVAQRASGIPLFIEELTRLVLESGGRAAPHEIPPTLNDSLMARLDRLGRAKEVCQIAAVIGGEFPYKLLEGVAAFPAAELQSDLAKLEDAGLIYARGEPPDSTYQFKHALIQDAAYDALLKSRRRELHGTVAQAMVERFAELAESQPAIIARHWTDAGRDDLAIPAWQKVGDATRARQAFKETEEAYRHALAILEKQPDSKDRDARELKLRSALGEVLQITRGYASPEAIEANRRARMLAEASGNLGQIVLDLLGTWIAITVTAADHSATNEIADRMLDLAEREGNPASRGFAHMVKLCNCYYRGDFDGCENYFALGRQFFDAPTFRNFRGAIAHTFGFAAYNAATLGRADAARDRLQHTLSVARENQSPYDLAFALQQQSNLCLMLREPTPAEGAAAEALALSEEHGFPYFGFTSRIALGWARAQLGQVPEGIELIRRGLIETARNRMRNFIPRYLTYLAAAQILDGAVADASGSLDQALEANPQELLYRPETIRLRGELQLSRGQSEQAQADFLEAIALARGMSAKGWELRATMSLARLLAQRQRRAEARTKLVEVYKPFTEGFDTADLREAKALLAELSD